MPGSEAKFKEIAAAYQALTDIYKENLTENKATNSNQTSYKKYDRETGNYQRFYPKTESSKTYRQHFQYRPFTKSDHSSTSNGYYSQQSSTTYGQSEPQFKTFEEFLGHKLNHCTYPPSQDYIRLYSIYYNAYVKLHNLYTQHSSNQYEYSSRYQQSQSNHFTSNTNSNASSNTHQSTPFYVTKVSKVW